MSNSHFGLSKTRLLTTSLVLLCDRVTCSKSVFFYGAAYQKSQSAVFMLPEKDVPSAVVGTIRR